MELANTTAAVETKYPGLARAQGALVEPVIAPEVKAADITPEKTIETTQPADITIEAPKTLSFKDLSEQEKLEAINEQLGTNYKSLAEMRPKEVKSKEQIAEEKENKKQKALSWGVENKKLKLEEYEKSIIDKSKSPRDLALAIFTLELQEENPKTTAEEAEEQFKDYYREELEDNSPIRKLRQKEMDKVVSGYLKDNYGKIDTLEQEYESHESSVQAQENYGRLVKTVSADLPKELTFSVPHITVEGAETTLEYKFPLEDSDIKDAKKNFLSAEMYEAMGGDKANLKDSDLSGEMKNYIRSQKFDKIVAAIASQHAERSNAELLAKLKAIPATGVAALAGSAEPIQTKPTPPTYPGLKNAQSKRT